MRALALKTAALVLMPVLVLMVSSCSGSTEPTEQPPQSTPPGWPLVPEPTHSNDFDVPDVSDTLVVIMSIGGKGVDFAPHWTQGTFTWNIDIQTQYEQLDIAGGSGGGWQWYGDQPGNYYGGTDHSSELLFENGAVDLRSPTPSNATLVGPTPTVVPMPRVLLFIEDGAVIDEPYNPRVTTSSCVFDFFSNYPNVDFAPCLFVGRKSLAVQPGLGERNRQRSYYVGATSAAPLTNPVYLARARFWERVLVDGAKSVRADPGFSKSVAYTRTTGTNTSSSHEFARSLDAELTLGSSDAIAASLSGSLSETFTTSREVSEEESVEVTHQVTGIDGKTVIFSVWRSVERYTFVDADGNVYTDPNYTFGALGEVFVRGDHEVLQSKAFDQ